MQRVNVVHLQREVDKMKKDIVSLKKRVALIPKPKESGADWDPDYLTSREKRLLKEVLDDLKKGRKDKFISARELRKNLGFKV